MSLSFGLKQACVGSFGEIDVIPIDPDNTIVLISDFTEVSINEDPLRVDVNELVTVSIDEDITVIEVC